MKKFLAGCLFLNMLGATLPSVAGADYEEYIDDDCSFVYLNKTEDCDSDVRTECANPASVSQADSRDLLSRAAHTVLDCSLWLVKYTILILGVKSLYGYLADFEETRDSAVNYFEGCKRDFDLYKKGCARKKFKGVCSELAHNAARDLVKGDGGFINQTVDHVLLASDYGYRVAEKKVKSFFGGK